MVTKTKHLTVIWNDAGLLREYAYELGFGAVLLFGGTATKWQRIRLIIRRIVQLTKISSVKIQRDIIKDYRFGKKWN